MYMYIYTYAIHIYIVSIQNIYNIYSYIMHPHACIFLYTHTGVSSGGTSNSTILPQGYRTGPRQKFAGIALDLTIQGGAQP